MHVLHTTFRQKRHGPHVRLLPCQHLGQTVENQTHEIEAAGFTVDRRRIITETVSGASAIQQRKGFMKLLDKLDEDNVLIVNVAEG